MEKAEEMEQWEQRREDVEDRLEDTKAMQEEIRDQLRALIVSKLMNDD